MRLGIVCIALSLLAFAASAAVAQVAVIRTAPADVEVAAALEQLIGDRIVVATGAELARGTIEPDARVSVDRAQSMLLVVAGDPPRTLSRALDPKLIARSPYAVALAAAELLDLLRNEPAAPIDEPTIVVPHSTSAPSTTDADARPRSTDNTASPARSNSLARDQPALPGAASQPGSAQPQPAAASISEASPEAEVAVADARALAHGAVETGDAGSSETRSARAFDYAFGLDLELQAQPGSDLSFVRPAAYGELAWGRSIPGFFWAVGPRVSPPFARVLQPTAAGPAADSKLHAQAFDAALQATAGYAFGRLALATHVAAGATYLHVKALDARGGVLGRDARFSPLLAAGLGARLSVALGFALAIRGEAQWAGAETIFRVGGERVLEGGPFRLGVLTGVLWESAFGPP